MSSGINKRFSVASEYICPLTCINESLKILLEKRSVNLEKIILNNTINITKNLFTIAHLGLEYLKPENMLQEKRIIPGLRSLKTTMFVRDAYTAVMGYTNSYELIESRIKDGLNLTLNLRNIFENNEVPENSLEIYKELQKIYENLLELANNDHTNEFFDGELYYGFYIGF